MYRPAHIAQLETVTGTAGENSGLGKKVLAGTSTKSKHFKSVAAAIKKQAKLVDPNDQDALKRSIDEFNEQDHCQVSQSLIARRTRYSNAWLSVASYYDDSVTEENIFHYEVIKKNLERFLPTMVRIMRPAKGYNVIRSSTLAEAFHHIIALVLQHAYDPITKEPKGFVLLTKGGMFIKLQDQLQALIKEHKLDRARRNKLYYGREHVQLIISCMLDDTKRSGPKRANALQSMARLLVTFYASCRPSTLGYTEKKLREANLYPKMKNVRIYRRGEIAYEIELDLQQFKGALRTVDANQQIITLHSVLMAHNALFDPTICFLALFFARGDFAKKYQTIEELCDDDSAEILLDPAKAEQPLFRVPNNGGNGFKDPPEPSSSEAASHTIGYWCKQAGLPRVGATAFRRDAGNLYGQQLGIEVAKMIMNHHTCGDVFQAHYSRTTNNIALVNYRLGEIQGEKESEAGEALKRDRRLHLFKSTAVEYMVRGGDRNTTRTQNQKTRTEEVAVAPEVLEIESNIQRVYNEFLNCFTPEASHYQKPAKQNVNRIFAIASGQKNTGKSIEFREGMKDRSKELKDNLFQLYEQSTKIKRHLMRKADRTKAQEDAMSFRTNALSGTTDEREAAVMALDGVVPEIKKAVDDYLPKAAKGKGRALGHSKSRLHDNDENNFETNVQQMIDSRRYKPLDAGEADTADTQDGQCEFKGDLQEWCKALSLESRIERQIQEDEEEPDPQTSKLVNLLKGITNSTAKASCPVDVASVECDEDFLDAPDVDESLETDVLNLPVGLVRRALLESFVEPILRERGVKVSTDDKTIYPCNLCGEGEKVFMTLSTYERHKAFCHSPWKELESLMKSDNSTLFNCPAQDGFVAKTVKKVFHHMITDKCNNQNEHLRIKIEHDKVIAPYHKPKIQPSEAVIPRDNKELKNVDDSMKWLIVDEGLKLRGVAESVYGPYPEAIVVNWESLDLVKIKEVDFNTFRTQQISMNITVVDSDDE